MTNPYHEELVKIADRLDQVLKVASAARRNEKPMSVWADDVKAMQDAATALRRFASSDSGVKGEPEPVAWIDFAENDNIRLWTSEKRRADAEMALGREMTPVFTAPPADAGMREALERRVKFDECGTPEPSLREMIRSWYDRIENPHRAQIYTDRFIEALAAPGATTKSDGGARSLTADETRLVEQALRDSGELVEPLLGPSDSPFTYTIAHDGFIGTIQGHYVTREGKEGVVLQQVGTRVVHVYGRKWIDADLPSDPSSTRATASLQGEDAVERVARYLSSLDAFHLHYRGFAERNEAAKFHANAILATGLVPDEAAIRADEREKCASEAFTAIISTLITDDGNSTYADHIAAAIRSNGRGA